MFRLICVVDTGFAFSGEAGNARALFENKQK